MADPQQPAAAPETLTDTLTRLDGKLDQILAQFARVQDTGAIATALDATIAQLAAIRSRLG